MDAVASSGVKVDHLLGRWFKSLLVEKARDSCLSWTENQEHAAGNGCLVQRVWE